MTSILARLHDAAPTPAIPQTIPSSSLTNTTQSTETSQDVQATSAPESRAISVQSPIPEEDESTGSKRLKPLAPANDGLSPSFHHHDGVEQPKNMDAADVTPKAIPIQQPTKPPPQPRSTATTPLGGTPPNGEVRKLTSRVPSFMKNTLQRINSHNSTKHGISMGDPKLQTTLTTLHTQQNAPTSAPPKKGRMGSFSLRNSPKSSQSNSPPSPISPTSTITSEERDEHTPTGNDPGSRPKRATTGLRDSDSPSRPKTGITWSIGNGGKVDPETRRRRSVSTDYLPRLSRQDPNDPTVGLVDTFSKPAEQGAGMKARRLSLSLPDEFVVDSCELDSEFKSSSAFPGRRGKRLGKGATAEVRIMARKDNAEELVAVKEFRPKEVNELEEEYMQKIKSEFSIAKSLHHPNIVETVRLCTHREKWNHVMEFCDNGELYSLVERGLFKTHYSFEDRLCFFKQLIRGVDYLHSHGIAHRDIKLENLLLSKDGFLKITDFGVSEVFSGEHPGLRAAGGQCGKNMGEVRRCAPGICGSLPYIAPEVLEKKGEYDPRPLDVWSCAIAFLTMHFGGSPWEAAKIQHQNYAKFKKGWDAWLERHPDGKITNDDKDGQPKCGMIFTFLEKAGLARLILKMLHPVPEMRITIREVVESSYIKGLECCCPETFEDPKCCVDATKKGGVKKAKATTLKKHNHIPPKKENTISKRLTHRFDMGHGYY